VTTILGVGNWYTNITVRSVDVARVAATLRSMQRTAYLSPLVRGCVVVYDRDSNMDDGASASLCKELSQELGTTAVLAMNADDDALWLMVAREGAERVVYQSASPARHGAAALCQELRRPLATPLVWAVLQAPVFAFEVHRHLMATRLLGLPSSEAILSYPSIEEGEVLGRVTQATVTHVEPER
jgi:hypothetical protein